MRLQPPGKPRAWVACHWRADRTSRMGLSQTLAQAAGWAVAAPVSRFVNLWETEAEREQPVLLAHGPRARKAEPLAQPQHRLKALNGASGRVEGLEAANPRHGPLDPEMVALGPLLQGKRCSVFKPQP